MVLNTFSDMLASITYPLLGVAQCVLAVMVAIEFRSRGWYALWTLPASLLLLGVTRLIVAASTGASVVFPATIFDLVRVLRAVATVFMWFFIACFSYQRGGRLFAQRLKSKIIDEVIRWRTS